MTGKPKSSVATYMSRRDRHEPDLRGGRGRTSSATRWLLREAAAIAAARSGEVANPLSWCEIATLAKNDGVVAGSGRPYDAAELRAAWSRLKRHDKLPLHVRRQMPEAPASVESDRAHVRSPRCEDAAVSVPVRHEAQQRSPATSSRSSADHDDDYQARMAELERRSRSLAVPQFTLDSSVGYGSTLKKTR